MGRVFVFFVVFTLIGLAHGNVFPYYSEEQDTGVTGLKQAIKNKVDEKIKEVSKEAGQKVFINAEQGMYGPLQFETEEKLAGLIELLLHGCASALDSQMHVWTVKVFSIKDREAKKQAAEDERNEKVATTFLTTALELGYVTDKWKTAVNILRSKKDRLADKGKQALEKGKEIAGNAYERHKAFRADMWARMCGTAGVPVEKAKEIEDCTADGKPQTTVCFCGTDTTCNPGDICSTEPPTGKCGQKPDHNESAAKIAVKDHLDEIKNALKTYFKVVAMNQLALKDKDKNLLAARIALGKALWTFGKNVLKEFVTNKALKAFKKEKKLAERLRSKTEVASTKNGQSNFVLNPRTVYGVVALSFAFSVATFLCSLRNKKPELYKPLAAGEEEV